MRNNKVATINRDKFIETILQTNGNNYWHLEGGCNGIHTE